MNQRVKKYKLIIIIWRTCVQMTKDKKKLHIISHPFGDRFSFIHGQHQL
jgi:hypothetical protein